MDRLEIQATQDTPYVLLDKEKGQFVLKGLSLPEDAVGFYKPILAWLDEYAKNPNPITEISIHLEYFNTASSKQLIQILLFLEKLNQKTKVIVKWYYRDIDDDMKELGQEYSEIIKIPFELVEIPS